MPSAGNQGRSPTRMRAIRLHREGGPEELRLDRIDTPLPESGEVLVRVHAAAITRDELEWPLDRLPAIPSYEFSGEVAAMGAGVSGWALGDEVFTLCGFDRHGGAADFSTVPANMIAPKPRSNDHVQSAAIPLSGLSAWQGLFDHGKLERGQRVLIHGAAGGVGHFATQLARWCGAYVIGSSSPGNAEIVEAFGAHEVIDYRSRWFEDGVGEVDLVFDTVGGDALEHSPKVVSEGGRIVSVAEEPRPVPARLESVYFVVEPNREQLVELARLVDVGDLKPAIDSVFPLSDARVAFERSLTAGKHGKVVLRVVDDEATRKG
jgi:NADPH:quinone reductase-like Zn-dependent oxidoreductase